VRKLGGFLCAAAIALPVPLLATPAAASTFVSCSSFHGVETWKPPLPKQHSGRTAKPNITITSTKVALCRSDDGKTRQGTLNASITWLDAGNCDTLMTHTPGQADPRIKGTITIAWNTRTKSTIAVSLRRTKPYVQVVTGTVTGGAFAGSKFSVQLLLKPPAGACQTKALSTTGFNRLTSLVIK
jgi:hypothetical protein